jgi:pheromone shutdown protein TraB
VISSGLTRFRASVLRASTTDDLGLRSTIYTAVGTINVDLRDQSANEQAYADGVAVVRQYEVRTRWPNIGRVSIDERDRLLVRGHTLRINAIRNLDERDRLAVLDCTEVV